MSAPPERAARVKAALRSAVLDDLSLKLLSFSVAVAIWAWLQSGQVVEQRARVSVRYLWPDQLARVGDVPDSLSVTLSGPQGRLRAAFLFWGFAKLAGHPMLRHMKIALITVLALASLALSGCIIVIEQAPAEKAAPAKKAAKPNPDSSTK